MCFACAIDLGGFSGSISHEVDKVGLKVGDRVRCLLDWDRRYRLMRSHTALHILWAALVRSIPRLEVVGTRVGVEHSRLDVKADRDALTRRLGGVEREETENGVEGETETKFLKIFCVFFDF
ncbi:MAG: hypothetical protein ACE5Z5_10900 [Candidatus Bathyarchaeia archaeon]